MNPLFMALTIGVTLLGAAILFFTISGILKLLRESEVARLPAAAEQELLFKQPGRYILHLEQPRLNLATWRVEFTLRDAQSGMEARSSPIIFRTQTSGFSTARVSLREFAIERAGSYRLVMTGTQPGGDLSRVAIIFTRPYAFALVLLILGTVFGGVCLIAGLVFTALQYVGKL